MTKSIISKPDQQIISKLQSQNPELVIETIEHLRNSGNVSYVPVLIELLNSSVSTDINSRIVSLLADIKHIDIIPILLEAIQNKEYIGVRKKLVSLCWENGLDFSSHLSLFVDLVIAEEFEVAFEAYTVITNMEEKITLEIVNSEIERMEASLNKVGEQKRPFLIDIIDHLPQLSE